jgi:hypothetical protein
VGVYICIYIYTITERSHTALQAALTSGEWYIDNNKLTENSKYKTSSSSSSSTSHTRYNYNEENILSTSTTSSIPSIIMNNNNNNNATTTLTTPTVELIPIKSFRNDYINISVS